MRVMVIGAGAREHALCAALRQSPMLRELWCVPGNPGTAELAHTRSIAVNNVAGLVALARAEAIDLVVPGSEAPLFAGVADAMAAAGVRCLGPRAAAAQLEASKYFAKMVALHAGVPTAAFRYCRMPGQAFDTIAQISDWPVVIKADGPAFGKGVVIAADPDQATAAVRAAMIDHQFGEAGTTLLIEQFLEGQELSVFALAHGAEAVCLGTARDYKRLGEADQGPNTGGMGAVSATDLVPAAVVDQVMQAIIRPTLAELVRRGTPFHGILYAGVMLSAHGPMLVEFNVRLGDPEAQALLPRLGTDLLALLTEAAHGHLPAAPPEAAHPAAVAVVLAAPGYPDRPRAESAIPFAHLTRTAREHAQCRFFQAGTKHEGKHLLPSGGRVLTVTGLGEDRTRARQRAYAAIATLAWPELVYRRDIGAVAG